MDQHIFALEQEDDEDYSLDGILYRNVAAEISCCLTQIIYLPPSIQKLILEYHTKKIQYMLLIPGDRICKDKYFRINYKINYKYNSLQICFNCERITDRDKLCVAWRESKVVDNYERNYYKIRILCVTCLRTVTNECVYDSLEYCYSCRQYIKKIGKLNGLQIMWTSNQKNRSENIYNIPFNCLLCPGTIVDDNCIFCPKSKCKHIPPMNVNNNLFAYLGIYGQRWKFVKFNDTEFMTYDELPKELCFCTNLYCGDT